MDEKVLKILEEVCEDDVVWDDRDVNLLESDLLDSLAFAELLVAFEEQLGVVIAPSEVSRTDMDTPNKIIELVKARSSLM